TSEASHVAPTSSWSKKMVHPFLKVRNSSFVSIHLVSGGDCDVQLVNECFVKGPAVVFRCNPESLFGKKCGVHGKIYISQRSHRVTCRSLCRPPHVSCHL